MEYLIAITIADAAVRGYTVIINFLINIIDEYCTLGFPCFFTYPPFSTTIYLANILNRGTLTLLNLRYPLSLVEYPILGPISPTSTPGRGLCVLKSLIGTIKA